jgi:hypothetical protein
MPPQIPAMLFRLTGQVITLAEITPINIKFNPEL